jgi:CheY-like chemotaxis protein
MQLKDATVLLVEDEPVLCEIMGVWFGRVAGRVLTAGNGAEALNVLEANRVDVVITDIRMPVMDGVTLLQEINASGKLRPSVVFVSGFSDLEPHDAYDLGAEAILEKPIDRDELLRVVTRILMDRDELWRTPVTIGAETAVLHPAFPSLAVAWKEHRVAFGRGGFCIESSRRLGEEAVGLMAEFRDDQGQLQAQGIVRWVAPAKHQAGIELLYVDSANLVWAVELAKQNEGAAFIPGSLARESASAAKSA